MAKTTYTTKTINTRLYEMRPTKADKQNIGLVPVIARMPSIDPLEQLADLVSTGACTAEQVFETWQSGHAVNQQARARQAVSPAKSGPTKQQWIEIFNKLSTSDETFVQVRPNQGEYVDNAIRTYWREHYTDGKAEVEASPTKEWLDIALPSPS